MPIARLEFELPTESAEHRDALDGGKWRLLFWEFDQYLRGRIKHEEMSEERRTLLEEIRRKLSEDATDVGLHLD